MATGRLFLCVLASARVSAVSVFRGLAKGDNHSTSDAAMAILSRSAGDAKGSNERSNRSLAWFAHVDEDGIVGPDTVLGYTDCSSQIPPVGSQANSAWWEARSGKHRLGKACQVGQSTACGYPPIRVPAVSHFGFCAVPKNGCTFWKALFMRMDNNPRWNSPNINDVHSQVKNQLVLDEGVLTDPSGLVVMVVRNPVTRVLSAWLDKRRDPNYLQWFAERPGTTKSFATFIETVAYEVSIHTADRHWAKQSDQCRLNYGAQYDFYLKAECRTLWGPSLFEYKDMKTWTDSGWGRTGTDPFIRDDRGAVRNASGPLNQAAPTQTRGSLKRGHSTGANGLEEVCKYYTPKLFWDVTQLYYDDIKLFNYQHDLQRIATQCGF